MRARTAALVPLPDGERAELEAVNDEPWWAFNYYLGELRSRVVVNVDIPTESGDIVELAAHEVYPGHHTERALKEQHLVRERGVLEETIQLVPTPQAGVAEGIATTGIDVLLDDDGHADAAEVIARHGIAYDVERASAIREAGHGLRPASVGETGGGRRAAAGVDRCRPADPRGRWIRRRRRSVRREVAAAHTAASGAIGSLPHRPDLAHVPDHVRRRPGPLRVVRARGRGAVPHAPDGARAGWRSDRRRDLSGSCSAPDRGISLHRAQDRPRLAVSGIPPPTKEPQHGVTPHPCPHSR